MTWCVACTRTQVFRILIFFDAEYRQICSTHNLRSWSILYLRLFVFTFPCYLLQHKCREMYGKFSVNTEGWTFWVRLLQALKFGVKFLCPKVWSFQFTTFFKLVIEYPYNFQSFWVPVICSTKKRFVLLPKVLLAHILILHQLKDL